MKFLHLSDLHLGKRIYEYSLIEEQKDILLKILDIINGEKIDGVFIAGDVYDKSVPSAEAVGLFDWFLSELAKRKTPVFIISGNHDSPERIAFGSDIMKASGVYLSPVYSGKILPITLQDEFGKINVYMLPFVKPLHVKRFFPDAEINGYTEAVKTAVSAMNIDKTARNILISHQFVTGATRSESEETVGGLDNVDGEIFDVFDYVALGHLHKRQFCITDKIHYSGTPLKYSFSEMNDEKSATIVEILKKGEGVRTRFVPLIPLREVKEIRGKFIDLISAGQKLGAKEKQDFYRIILTDENDVPDAMSRLKKVYPNALCLLYDNARTKNANKFIGEAQTEKSMLELFEEFYKLQNNAELKDVQKEHLASMIEEVEGGQL